MTTSSNRIKGQERLIELFEAEGVEVISGIVDVHFMHFHQRAKAAGMKMVGTHHEVATVNMAEAASRMTGKPQVCMAAYGPGVANMVGGVVVAREENVPLIVLATQRSKNCQGAVRNGIYQYWDQLEVMRPITKYQAVVNTLDRLDEAVRACFRQATSGTPGPVYLEVNIDVMWGEADFPPALPAGAYRSVELQQVPEAQLAQAADLLANAEFPVILAGQGIHTARGHDELEALARTLKCAVIPTFGAKGVLPENDPQTLIFGFEGSIEACADADVVLAVGTSIGEPVFFGEAPRWGEPGKQKWIHVERNPARLHTNRLADCPLVGDLKAVLPQLTERLQQRGVFDERPRLVELKQKQLSWRSALAERSQDVSPMDPGFAFQKLREAVPDEAILVRDGGCTAIWELMLFEQRSKDFLWNSHIAQLGCGLPYANGAALVDNTRPVLLITGDGAVGFQWMEFETAVRESLPVLVVVNCDSCWGMELMDFYDGKGSEENCPGVMMAPVCYDEMARAIGGHGEFVERADDIAAAVDRSLASGKPAVIQLMTDFNINANTVAMPELAQILTFYNLDGEQGYGHFEDLT
ncbi:thiamine pyrophosphate-binding protein [Pseudomaricurvus alkylphenolicus]|uniref:thiamine pyrophosphate-binding protein n=1 Tax=Pseudomaricurvus alkylphenolicus TaxID=1306991 RepID=UPI00141E12B8|nr:thiamine pyrophosphate-binding protein [Pseudomaricurvus alkylphenolicus]NIB38390.1 thiamine pyrophosphate-binding protein [Pseudomaricurvus alkylphenolicus]